MLHECRTPWLVRQDADDVSHPQRLGRILNAVKAAPQAGMFYSLANYHPRRSAVGTFRSTRGTPNQLRSIVRDGYLLAICHSTVVLNVDKVRSLGGYRVRLHNEDADLWWRMALEHDIHCIPEELVGFRQSETSVSAQNFDEQMLASLYVQYLLLSHLTKRAPQPFAAIRRQLSSLLSPAMIRAKEALRRFNIHFAEKKYSSAATALTASALASPAYLLRRLRDEFVPLLLSPPITNGVRPQLFFERQEAFWQ
jgi:hypothetical protein